MTESHGSTTNYSLIRRLEGRNDNEAWSQFCNSYFPLIFSWARRRRLTPDEAAEVAQDVLIALVELYRDTATAVKGYDANVVGEDSVDPEAQQPGARKGRYDPSRGRFRTWLRTVTHNEVSDFFRRKRKRREMRVGESTFLRIVDSNLSKNPSDAAIREFDHAILCIKLRSALQEFEEWLTEKWENSKNAKRSKGLEQDLAIVRFIFNEGKKYDDVASLIGISTTYLGVRICRLRGQFRDLFPELRDL